MNEAREALERVFGFASFRPGQQEILEAVFAGENILAVMPTGSGKSLGYQLPAIVRKGLTIVVSPLIALMRDQVQQLQARGIAAAALNSSNSGEDNAAIENGLRRERYRLVYVAPERLVRPDTPALLREAGANVFAIDEAHCVSRWGHDFRPEYLGLAQAAQAIGNLQLIAVTGTADAPTRADIVRKLFSAQPRVFVRSFDRPNIHLAMRRKANPSQQIEATVACHKGQSGIVYCGSRKGVEKLAETLSGKGILALAYHAGLDAGLRSARQDEFLRNDGTVIVATIAFGMGIDKPNVRFVCHADLPQSIEAYYQEIGRAGRDGLPADTLTLFSDSDIQLRGRQISDSVAPQDRKRMEKRKLNALIALCESPRCRRQTLLAAFGEASKPCGNCDICDGKWPLFNGAIPAQKIMSAIRRTSGRFFPGHLANLLVGQASDAIRRHGHDLLPTFGIGKEFNPGRMAQHFLPASRGGSDRARPGRSGSLDYHGDRTCSALGRGAFDAAWRHDLVERAQGRRAAKLGRDRGCAGEGSCASARGFRAGQSGDLGAAADGPAKQPVRRAQGQTPRNRERPKATRLRHFPRQRLDRDGPGASQNQQGFAAYSRRRTSQGRTFWRDLPCRHCQS
jgi:ATP-dependent DNA helicase RecQ